MPAGWGKLILCEKDLVGGTSVQLSRAASRWITGASATKYAEIGVRG